MSKQRTEIAEHMSLRFPHSQQNALIALAEQRHENADYSSQRITPKMKNKEKCHKHNYWHYSRSFDYFEMLRHWLLAKKDYGESSKQNVRKRGVGEEIWQACLIVWTREQLYWLCLSYSTLTPRTGVNRQTKQSCFQGKKRAGCSLAISPEIS